MSRHGEAIRELALDVWSDLREKRLWPVAALLLLALLALPLLSGGSGTGKGLDAAPPTSSPEREAAVRAAPNGASDLGVFRPKDPFRPAVRRARRTPASGGPPPSGASDIGIVKVRPGASTRVSSGASDVPPAPASGGGPVSSSPTGTAAPTPAPSSPTVRRRERLYTYVADVQFGRVGSERRRTLQRLELLPNDRRPLLVFLGVTADRRRALFLVDSTLSQSGEGRCKPDVEVCTFLYLTPRSTRNEHFFADADGREYALRVLRLRRVAVRSSRRARAGASRRPSAARGEEPRAFSFPLFFADEQG